MTTPSSRFGVSVIVRFGNEQVYIRETLQAIREQVSIHGATEIIAVDNESSDGSRAIAAEYADQIVTMTDYRPGRALNRAISRAAGEFIVVLSAHAIPADRNWLARLLEAAGQPNVVAAYGAQLYNCHSRYLSKQVFDVFSTDVPRFETVDSDFWNANSIFPRRIWQETPFHEDVCELEDHYWTKLILRHTLCVRYEPRALVYHYSHIDRLDRRILLVGSKDKRELLSEAEAYLSSLDVDWPLAMRAGMIVNSLSDTHFTDSLVSAVGRHLLHNPDFDVRWRMAQALGKVQSPASARLLVDALDDRSLYPRTEAAWSLAKLGELGVKQVLAHLPRLSTLGRLLAALALGSSGVAAGERIGIKIVREALANPDPRVRLQAAYVAGELSETIGAAMLSIELCQLLSSPFTHAIRIGCWALGCHAATGGSIDWLAIESLAWNHEDPLVRYEAVVALGKRARATLTAAHVELLPRFLSDASSRVRYGSIQSLRLLAETGYRVAYAHLIPSDQDFGVLFERTLLNATSSRRRQGMTTGHMERYLPSKTGGEE